MKFFIETLRKLGIGKVLALSILCSGAALAQDVPVEPAMFKGDIAWMMTATLLVTFMAVPGLALFYGGLVRTKNMLSMLMQVTTVFTLIVVLWAIYGYSLALTEGNPIIGGLSQLFLAGTTADSTAGTFTDGIVLPETIFIAFQSTFAGLTCALIVGSMAERAKFAGVLIFAVISATPWGHWHIGISCFLPRGIVIQLSVCSNMPAFRHRSPAKAAHAEPLSRAQRVWLGHRRPATSSTSPWALCSPCGGRGPPPRYTSLASTGLVAWAKDVSRAVQGRGSGPHRGLERISFSLLVSYWTLARLVGRPHKLVLLLRCAVRLYTVAPLSPVHAATGGNRARPAAYRSAGE
mgnify:CR=1 FL=1